MISREQFQMQGNENVKFVPMQQNELNIIFNPVKPDWDC